MMFKKAVPNLISLSRLPLTLLIWHFISNSAFTAAFITFIAAALTDWFDGLVARWLGAESELGAILDPFADKFLYIGALWAMYDPLPIFWTIVFTVPPESFLMLIRIPPLKNLLKPSIKATKIGKIKMGFQSSAVILMMLWFIWKTPILIVLGMTIANIAVFFSWWSLWSHFQNR